MIVRRMLRFEAEALAGLELPGAVAHGAGDGPRLSLIAGVHGCEYSSIAAVTRFMASLDTSELCGSVTAVPVVNRSSFEQRTPFVTPEDGKNLNRCFPGSPDGTYSDVLARAIFDELITDADVVVDLHGGDQVEALEPFSLYDESPVEERARAIAVAFGLPYVVRAPASGAAVTGTTSSAAADAGVPAIIAEAGGCGLLEESAVRLHLDGLTNALRQLGMLPGDPSPPPAGMRSIDRFVWLRSSARGWWEPAVGAGDEVAAGSQLGTVRDLYGDVVEQVRAPEDGVILFLTVSPAVEDDGLLLGLGAGLAPV